MLKEILSAVLLTACTANSQSNIAGNTKANHPVVAGKGTAVLELFTSEGCSSCPAADRLAAQLKEEYKDKLIVLEFHVDYWDRLGWKDPFSKAAYTQRQRDYREKFQLESVYTPQAVINGTYEAVGSDEEKLKSFIDKTINDGNGNSLTVEASGENNIINIKWKYSSADDATINFALVQKQALTQVKAGENEGRKLAHSNVVRDFISVNTKSNQPVQFNIPDGLAKKDMQLVAYAQQNGKIVSATVLENL